MAKSESKLGPYVGWSFLTLYGVVQLLMCIDTMDGRVDFMGDREVETFNGNGAVTALVHGVIAAVAGYFGIRGLVRTARS